MPVFSKIKKQFKKTAREMEEEDDTLAPEEMDHFSEEDEEDFDDDVEEDEEEEGEEVEEGDEEAEEEKPAQKELQFNEPAQWVERMALTATKPLPLDLSPDDDPKREEVFIQHALLSALRGVSMLEKVDVPWKRPADYYAEMFKADTHMDRIKESIIKSKAEVEQRAHRRSMKDQKKYGKEVQAEVLRQRAKHKRDTLTKVSEWRKKRGRNGGLDEVLNDEDGDDKSGGKDRGGKRQRREGARPKNLNPGGGKGKQRPGKNARRRK